MTHDRPAPSVKSHPNKLSRQPRLPNQRWQIATSQDEVAKKLAEVTRLSPLLTQVLINRGIHTAALAQLFLNPEAEVLPLPTHEFPDLPIALDLLEESIATRQPIAICGDYDADGMTSTALLLRALRFLGADVDYAIPSRMQEGYGINQRIVEEFYQQGIRLILTVDNGIAAHVPIAKARELGLTVIVTDHHDIPPTLPDANAILNPKLIREDSPYRGVAGVGVAYILAVCLAQRLKRTQELTTPLIELFTLGTIADLAPLTGVNRRWVRRGLKLLPNSKLIGVQALIQVAGLSSERELKPEAIGFRLGPRINAIGRIADPQIVIDLLTTEDEGRALELAMKCEQVNQLRQRLCELIEGQAIAWCEQNQFNPAVERVLVLVQPDWHHGVIGIVASRLVERYGVPVFIGTYEGETHDQVRGSARGIPEFNVFDALQFCQEVLEKFGGHRAAGGFSLSAEHLDEFRSRLQQFAAACLQPEHLKPLVSIDVQIDLADLTLELYQQIDHLHPCGIENPDPVFWTPEVRVMQQQAIGRDQAHLKLVVTQDGNPSTVMKAIAWRWGEYCPLPERLDIAYRLRTNDWNGEKTVELELIGVRLPGGATLEPDPVEPMSRLAYAARRAAASPSITEKDEDIALDDDEADGNEADNDKADLLAPVFPFPALELGDRPSLLQTEVEFYYSSRPYRCQMAQADGTLELRVKNPQGQVLRVQPQQPVGLLGKSGESPQQVDVLQPHYFNLIQMAVQAWQLAEVDLVLKEKDQLLKKKDQQLIETEGLVISLQQQLEVLRAKAEPSPVETIPVLPQSAEEGETVAHPKTRRPRGTSPMTQGLVAESGGVWGQTAPSPSVITTQDVAAIRQQLRSHLGDTVWFCLQERSQKDLYFAYKQRASVQATFSTTGIPDYSEAGQKLSLAAEREIAEALFEALAQLLPNQGVYEIRGVSLISQTSFSLGLLPPLLANQWRSFQEKALMQVEQPSEQALYTMAEAVSSVKESDRTLLHQFLQQWDHPLAGWLLRDPVAAASAIDQMHQLRAIATHPERVFYPWHFALLESSILGNSLQPGVLQGIYSKRG